MTERFEAEWSRCAPWIMAALVHCRGTHLIEDVREMAATGGCTLFFPGKRCAMVCQIIHHPRLVQMHHWLCGGDLRELLAMLPSVEAHGLIRGATLFTTGGRLKAGRSGWDRILRSRGYAPNWQICMKDLA